MTEKRPPIRLGSESMGKKRFQCPRHWTLAQRLDHYTDKSGGPDACWPWMGTRVKGYGLLSWKGKMQLAHRLAWAEAHGPIPRGKCVLHGCDNPPCRNEAHLWLGSHVANMADRDRKGRLNPSRGEKNGKAKLTEAAVATIRLSSGRQIDIAIAFGVSKQTISKIKKGRLWALTP